MAQNASLVSYALINFWQFMACGTIRISKRYFNVRISSTFIFLAINISRPVKISIKALGINRAVFVPPAWSQSPHNTMTVYFYLIFKTWLLVRSLTMDKKGQKRVEIACVDDCWFCRISQFRIRSSTAQGDL